MLQIENAQEKLLTQGRKMLVTQGYGYLNIKALAAGCGMSTGSVYSYFRGKDDLVEQIMERDWNKVIAVTQAETCKTAPLVEKLERIYDAFVRFENDFHLSAGGNMRISQVDSEFRARNMRQMYDAVASLLQAEIARGLMPQDLDTRSTAYILVQLFTSAGRNPGITFDDLWSCLAFGKRQERS